MLLWSCRNCCSLLIVVEDENLTQRALRMDLENGVLRMRQMMTTALMILMEERYDCMRGHTTKHDDDAKRWCLDMGHDVDSRGRCSMMARVQQ